MWALRSQLAAGLLISNGAVDNIVLGMEDRVALWSARALVRLAKHSLNPVPALQISPKWTLTATAGGDHCCTGSGLFFYRLFGQRDADPRLEPWQSGLPGTA